MTRSAAMLFSMQQWRAVAGGGGRHPRKRSQTTGDEGGRSIQISTDLNGGTWRVERRPDGRNRASLACARDFHGSITWMLLLLNNYGRDSWLSMDNHELVVICRDLLSVIELCQLLALYGRETERVVWTVWYVINGIASTRWYTAWEYISAQNGQNTNIWLTWHKSCKPTVISASTDLFSMIWDLILEPAVQKYMEAICQDRIGLGRCWKFRALVISKLNKNECQILTALLLNITHQKTQHIAPCAVAIQISKSKVDGATIL